MVTDIADLAEQFLGSKVIIHKSSEGAVHVTGAVEKHTVGASRGYSLHQSFIGDSVDAADVIRPGQNYWLVAETAEMLDESLVITGTAHPFDAINGPEYNVPIRGGRRLTIEEQVAQIGDFSPFRQIFATDAVDTPVELRLTVDSEGMANHIELGSSGNIRYMFNM